MNHKGDRVGNAWHSCSLHLPYTFGFVSWTCFKANHVPSPISILLHASLCVCDRKWTSEKLNHSTITPKLTDIA